MEFEPSRPSPQSSPIKCGDTPAVEPADRSVHQVRPQSTRR